MHEGRGGALTYEIFDLLYLNGVDLTPSPLIERKALLEKLLGKAKQPNLRYSEHYEGSGEDFFREACRHDLEGILSKRADAPYESTRNRNWLKVKCSKEQEFVIAGYTPSSKGLPGFGSLILGVYENDHLKYVGRVGTGFSLKQRARSVRDCKSSCRRARHFPSDRGHLDWPEPDGLNPSWSRR
jgi:bifunctional non-homologous end joining protein LigD